jgi:hypothetical protein
MVKTTLFSLTLGALGALAALMLGAPAPMLTGPAVVVSVAGVAGVTCGIPTALRNVCFLAIGLGLGASVSPEVFASALKWPVSLLAMVVSLLLIMPLGSALLRRRFGCDPRTAVLGSAPGHLSFVLGLSLDTGANTAFIAVVQSLRVLLLTLATPATIALVTDADLSPVRSVAAMLSPLHLGLLAAGGAAMGAVLYRAKVPAAFLLGGMLVSVAAHGTGATPGIMPPLVTDAALVAMGTLIGTRFTGVRPGQIRQAAVAALLLTGGSVGIVIVLAVAVVAVVDLPLADVLLALAPGGLETMIAMSPVVGADPAFVGFHHVARIFLLSALIPLAMARAGRAAAG